MELTICVLLHHSPTFRLYISTRSERRFTHGHGPLDAQQAKQKCDAAVPTCSIIYDALRAEYERRGVHLGPRGHGKQDDDDYCGAS